jgi:hypothetical protein
MAVGVLSLLALNGALPLKSTVVRLILLMVSLALLKD